jgi:hypothetical protein
MPVLPPTSYLLRVCIGGRKYGNVILGGRTAVRGMADDEKGDDDEIVSNAISKIYTTLLDFHISHTTNPDM